MAATALVGPRSSELFIGLMSGTSLDGVDAVLADFSSQSLRVRAHAARAFPSGLRAEWLALNTPGDNELHRAALAANALARLYADTVRGMLHDAGVAAAEVAAIGAHGQTVRHRPGEFDGTGYTLQLNQPALVAELCGIPVVADFRARDVAAGGQGAPLVPAFHRGVFAEPGRTVAVLNLGGIGNLSVLGARGDIAGFDCGPGNALLDLWCERHTGQRFDAGGAWGAQGVVIDALLATFLAEPFIDAAPPKSTGRDLFHAGWLESRLGDAPGRDPRDVQATLAAFTVEAAARHVERHAAGCERLLVCGGGALNDDLMRRLAARLPHLVVASTETAGLPPLQVEAAAFAWLARQMLRFAPGNLPEVTGARGLRVLGAYYPA